MLIQTADYQGSFIKVEDCPKSTLPEFAFIGRSNVGKSSLINYLTGRKKLSKVSVTPGKTKTINYFLINKHIHLVDLPGYGYAKTSKTEREKWDAMIRGYLTRREQLLYVCLLIDSRIPPQKIDLDFINWMGEKRVPFFIIFTKADKPGTKEISATVQRFRHEMLKSWEELPPFFVTSAEKKHGKEEVWKFIAHEAALVQGMNDKTINS